LNNNKTLEQQGASRSTSETDTKMQRLDLEAKVEVYFKVGFKASQSRLQNQGQSAMHLRQGERASACERERLNDRDHQGESKRESECERERRRERGTKKTKKRERLKEREGEREREKERD